MRRYSRSDESVKSFRGIQRAWFAAWLAVGPQGQFYLASFWGLLLNRWALWQFAHAMLGATQRGCFVVAAIGAYYLLGDRDLAYEGPFCESLSQLA